MSVCTALCSQNMKELFILSCDLLRARAEEGSKKDTGVCMCVCLFVCLCPGLSSLIRHV